MLKSATPFPRRRLRAAGLIGMGLVLISIIFLQQLVARSQAARELKPPFRLIKTNDPLPASGVPPLPIDAPIILTQTFDSSYSPLFTINGSGWHQISFSGIVDTFTWGRVSGPPITNTVWNAGTNPPGTNPLTPGTPYTNNQRSLLVYGPLDLRDYGAAVMTATYYSDVQAGDFFGAAYSTDGTNFYAISSESGREPSLSIKRTGYYNLNAATRQPNVWIAFYFTSNDDNQNALGTYLDDVVVRAAPLSKTYMPIVARAEPPTPTPTATPSSNFVYNYTFGSGSNTDTQFIEWGNKVVDADCFSTDSGGCKWGQDIVTSGHPSGAMTMYQTGLDALAGASPNNTAPTDFELSADFYVIQGKSDARLGLVFDTSAGAFGRNGDTPYFDPNRNLYKFDLQFNENDNTVLSYYRLQKCGIDINTCTNIVEKTQLPAGLVGNTGAWNTIAIQRLGNNIKVYVNGSLLLDVSDSTYVGAKKYGVFLQTKRLNNPANPIKIRFDNVRVRSLP